jgi:hypothetical protein
MGTSTTDHGWLQGRAVCWAAEQHRLSGHLTPMLALLYGSSGSCLCSTTCCEMIVVLILLQHAMHTCVSVVTAMLLTCVH